jgi:TPR repeat protein
MIELEDLRVDAEKGDADVQKSLGDMYRDGATGLDADLHWVIDRYSDSAKQGHVEALHELGDIYRFGKVADQDYAAAHFYYGLAAAKGNEHSARILEQVASNMTSDQIVKSIQFAREWDEANG